MSTFIEEDNRSIENRDELVTWIAEGAKPKEDWRIGLEHEKILFDRASSNSTAFDDARGVTGLLSYLVDKHGWQPAYEGEHLIGLTLDGASISLEPGGQVELSGSPVDSVHDTCCEITTHLQQIQPFCEEHGLGLLSLGYNPRQSHNDVPWVPKSRYRILRNYLESNGGDDGPRMMSLSTTVQINLDYSDEIDLVRKTRVSFACQALIAALFANSPFANGADSGFQSKRNQVWLGIDPEWTGIPSLIFDSDFGYEKWIDYLLDRPCVFERQKNTYAIYKGGSFRQRLAEGKRQNAALTFSDWQTHLTTIFTDVRIKRFIELRAIDGQPHSGLCAMPAFWTGILYDAGVLDQVYIMTQDWTLEELLTLRNRLPKEGLGLMFRGRSGWDWVNELTRLAAKGLAKRHRIVDSGSDERIYLDHLYGLIDRKQTLAEYWLRRFQDEWAGDISRVYEEADYFRANDCPLLPPRGSLRPSL